MALLEPRNEKRNETGKIEYPIRMIGPLNEKTMTAQMKRNWERSGKGQGREWKTVEYGKKSITVQMEWLEIER